LTQNDPIDERTIYLAGTIRVDKAKQTIARELSEEAIADRVKRAGLFVDQFLRALKNIGIYRHNVAHYKEYLERPYQLLTDFLRQYETLAMRVEPLGFKYFDSMIYQEDASEQNIAHKFYRDGVRILIFRNGVEEEELLQFALLCMTNFHSAEFMFEDMVSLMWKASFAHIEYVIIESFAVGTESQQEAKAEIDKIVNYLYQQMTADTEDRFQFARLSLEDLEIEMQDIEQVKGVVIKGKPASSEQKARILAQAEEEDAERALGKLVTILLKVMEDEIDHELAEALQDIFSQVLDSFLIHEDFRGINQMLRKMRALYRKQLPQANLTLLQNIERGFITRMGEAERLGRVGEILDSYAQVKDPQEVFRYLSELDEQAIVPLLGVLERMEKLEGRRLICDALAQIGREQLDVFVRRLRSEKANVVRDMLYIIDKLNPPDKLAIISRLLEHPNLLIRLEALQALGNSGDQSCLQYVMKALNDKETQMRMTAARLLINFDMARASRTLLTIVRSPDFSKRSSQEMQAFYAALVSCGTPDAINFFREELRETSRLAKKKLIEHKKELINGLALSSSITAYKLLKAELGEGIKEDEVRELAERVCARLKERLLGSGERDV